MDLPNHHQAMTIVTEPYQEEVSMINVASTRALITRSLRLAFFIGLIGLLAVKAHASTPTDGETPLGLQPGAPAGSYALSDLDHINLYNGNLNFTLPLMHIGGRGGAQMTMNLTPLELKWRVFEIYIPEIPPNPAYYSYTLLPPGVWNPIQPGYGPGVLLGRRAATDGDCGINFSPEIRYTLTRLTFIAADGTEYELRDQSTQGKPQTLELQCVLEEVPTLGRGKIFVTADGTAMTFVSDTAIEDHITYGEVIYPTGYLFLRDGTRFRVEGGLIKSLTDRNGNVLNFSYDQYNRVSVITDSINRTVNVAYGDLANGGFNSITWRGSSGTPRTLKVWGGALSSNFRVGNAQGSSTYTQKTSHQLFPDIPNTGDDLFDTGVFSAVELPDGRRYRFSYNSYGELARCELPTGGSPGSRRSEYHC
jgi:YD repeat-containing protein